MESSFSRFILRYRILHIVFWILFVVNYMSELLVHGGQNQPFWNVFILCVSDTFIKMVGVYVNVYFLLPRFFLKGKYLVYLLLSVATVVLFAFLSAGMSQLVRPLLLHNMQFSYMSILFISDLIDLSLLTIAFSGVIAVHSYVQLEKKNHRLEKERLESEMAFLKLQMNPHFLFNAINSIFILIDLNKNEARELLHKFSTMLRYQLYECNAERVSIDKEIEFIETYCLMEQKRKGEWLRTDFIVGDEVTDFSIAPFIIFPFVENAFKHAVENQVTRQIPIVIEINYCKNQLLLKVKNSSSLTSSSKVGGIGLANVKRRLNMLYENKHSLEISNGQNQFSVELKLQVN